MKYRTMNEKEKIEFCLDNLRDCLDILDDCDEEITEIDVRLWVDKQGHIRFSYGDPCYDTEHGVAYGYTTLDRTLTKADLEDIAYQMVGDLDEDLAMYDLEVSREEE